MSPKGVRQIKMSVGLLVEKFKREIHGVIISGSNKRHVCGRFVPHGLTDEKKSSTLSGRY